MSKKTEVLETSKEETLVTVKLVWQSSWVNIKYEWWIIEMKKNVPIEVTQEIYEKVLSNVKGYKIIKV